MDSRLYWIWLSRAMAPGDRHMNGLLDAFGTAQAVYEASPSGLQEAGLPAEVCSRLTDHSLEEARRIFDRTLQNGDWILTPEDALYPPQLRHLSAGCPAVLYCRGVMPDLAANPAVAVVGTRRSTPQGEQEAFALAAGLAAGGMVVVSGGANGIDAAAHRGALSVGGVTIVVMACELSGNYPAETADVRRMAAVHGGLLVSEFPPGSRSDCVYPIRNRLMVGLSHGVCVGQTPHRSGARITARIAREQGADVFALPGSVSGHFSDGANEEIRNGAMLVRGASDILEEYAPRFPGMLDVEAGSRAEEQARRQTPPVQSPRPLRKKRTSSAAAGGTEPPEKIPAQSAAGSAAPSVCPVSASDTARQVWEALADTPRPVDELAQQTGLPVARLLAALTELEMLGAAQQQAGQQYVRK